MANSFSVSLTTAGPLNPQLILSSSLTNQRPIEASFTMFDENSTGYGLIIWGDVDKTVNPNIQTQENTIANPTVAPTLSASGTGSALSAIAYYVKTTITDGYGQTLPSPEATLTIATAGENLVISLPALPSGRNLSTNIFVGTASGGETLQANTTASTYTLSTALVAGAALPTVSTLIGSTLIPYSASVPVTLSTGDGPKTIYATIQNNLGKNSLIVSANTTLDTTPPVLTVSSVSTTTLGEESGVTNVTFSFTSNSVFQQYAVQAVPSATSLYGSGQTIGSVYGSSNTYGKNASGFPANTAINVDVNGVDLTLADAGDGTKVIKVFAQDMAGNWST